MGCSGLSRDVEITILNRKYTLRSEGEEGELLEVAAYVDGRLREVGKATTAAPTSVAILGALNIASEFFEYKRKVQATLEEADAQNEAVLALVDKALIDAAPPGDAS